MRAAKILLVSTALTATAQLASANDILVSTTSDRASPVFLDGSTVAGDAYVFFITATPESLIKDVEFFIDGTSVGTDKDTPYDMKGDQGALAKAFDTNSLVDGVHVLDIVVDISGTTMDPMFTATFTVDNASAPLTPGNDLLLTQASVDAAGTILTLEGFNFDRDVAPIVSLDLQPLVVLSSTSTSLQAQLLAPPTAGDHLVNLSTNGTLVAGLSDKDHAEISLTIGAVGPQGPAGNDGADGGTGPQGPAGNDGADGAPGAQGPAGNDGADGATGAQGPAGNDGADGATGAQGPAGNDGADGATGAQGPAGNDGADGATGAQGPAGNDGADGATGAQGPAGNDGADGATGAQGPAGNDGADGATGAQGPAGNDGADGATGAQGPAGNDGADGATGAQGPAGNDGAVGAVGPQGPAGNDGAVGAVGPQGPVGNDGPDGAAGPQGPVGNDGAVGAVGPQGPAGIDGPIGAVGPQGPPGNDGADGAAGAAGPAGPTGADGASGGHVVDPSNNSVGLAYVGGGESNSATGGWAMIPGGSDNVASGDYSFAAGFMANASQDGSFVWGDSLPGSKPSTGMDSFSVYADGGSSFFGGGLTAEHVAISGSPVIDATGAWVGVDPVPSIELGGFFNQTLFSGGGNVLEVPTLNYSTGSAFFDATSTPNGIRVLQAGTYRITLNMAMSGSGLLSTEVRFGTGAILGGVAATRMLIKESDLPGSTRSYSGSRTMTLSANTTLRVHMFLSGSCTIKHAELSSTFRVEKL